jgi:hypothetical protein
VRLPAEAGTPYETADGTTGEVRSFHPHDRIRLSRLEPGRREPSIVQVTVRPAPSGATIGFHEERLADAKERERRRHHWTTVMDELGRALDGTS